MSMLHKLGFINFSNNHKKSSYYTVVGDNSGPNQAALYTGYPLQGGRSGIKQSTSHDNNNNNIKWLWDILQDTYGYATLKAEDICISNSNMVQSMKPNTTHGQQLYNMFCFDFDRPNCLGKNMTAEYLLDYVQQFIQVYSSTSTSTFTSEKQQPQQATSDGVTTTTKATATPWAAFLSFIDAHEDSLTLIRYLDDLLANFLNKQKKNNVLSNTLVVFLSDHGLHYGPSFNNAIGERERAQPLLHIHLPVTLHRKSQYFRDNLQANANGNFYITPYDVHETILHILSLNTTSSTDGSSQEDSKEFNKQNTKKLGLSLLYPLPTRRTVCLKTRGIPKKYCPIIAPDQNDGIVPGSMKKKNSLGDEEESSGRGQSTGLGTCTFMKEPPSVYSFFADIPKENRPRWPDCSLTTNTLPTALSSVGNSIFSGSKGDVPLIQHEENYCYCATNKQDWFPCDVSHYHDSIDDDVHLTMKSCGYHDLDSFLDLNITVPRRKAIVNRYLDKQRQVQQEQRESSATRQGKTVTRRTIFGNDDADDDKKDSMLPNILFIEVDSVSVSSANRHFPKLQSLLHDLRIQYAGSSSTMMKSSNDTSNKMRRRNFHHQNHYSCPTGFCSVMFNKTSVVGQHSIPNQLAALSGCVDRNFPNSSLYLYKAKDSDGVMGNTGINIPTFDTWCPGQKPKKRRKRRKNTNKKSPWLFDIVRDLGYVSFFGEEFCYGESPYVVQNQAFPLNVDIELDTVFCRLASNIKRKLGTTLREPLWAVEHDSSKKPNPCVDGRSRQQLAFEHIQGIWDAYPDVPKFAYLNSLAAHDYSIDVAYQTLGQEAYDDLLSEFLIDMLSSSSASDRNNKDLMNIHNTIIVLRSDHGVQGGPAPIDYSAQIEHMNPWNNLIIPERFLSSFFSNGRGAQQEVSLSKVLETLVFNQHKLVTGFDLYHTLRDMLTTPGRTTRQEGRKTQSHQHDNQRDSGDDSHLEDEEYYDDDSNDGDDDTIPDWSYNLMTQEVPESRSCSDARIPVEFCPCMEERTDVMPYFYVGHAEKLAKLSEIKDDQHSPMKSKDKVPLKKGPLMNSLTEQNLKISKKEAKARQAQAYLAAKKKNNSTVSKKAHSLKHNKNATFISFNNNSITTSMNSNPMYSSYNQNVSSYIEKLNERLRKEKKLKQQGELGKLQHNNAMLLPMDQNPSLTKNGAHTRKAKKKRNVGKVRYNDKGGIINFNDIANYEKK